MTSKIAIGNLIALTFTLHGLDTGLAQTVGQTVGAPPISRNAFYVEAFGQGVVYSFNYDYRFADHLTFRAGFTSWSLPAFPFIAGGFSFTGFPLMLNFLSGDGDGHFELGMGVVPSTISIEGKDIFFGTEISGKKDLVLGTGTIGFRLQPRDGGFLFRIGIVPMLASGHAALTGGLSLGAAF